MEYSPEDPQFDSFLGGSQTLPGGFNLSEFIKHRMEEVVMLTEAIDESPFRGQAFQRLPKHMRRRQMSHYIKRLPRRLQRPYLMSLKDGPPVPNKRPSRKYRRRPGNLLLEYNRRQKTSVWLETHIWHAKRFHMTTKWGYKLPKKPTNKSFRACYRAISEHCLLVDMSYYNCVELTGCESELLEGLKRCTSTACGLTFGAKMYLSGAREGSVTLFHPDSYPYGVIGIVRFMWQPICGDQVRKIWIWVHPQIHTEVVECFKLLFDLSCEPTKPPEEDVIVEKEFVKQIRVKNKGKRIQIEHIKLEPRNVPFVKTPKFTNKSESVTMTLLKDTLNRFRLTGPLSQAIISQAFTIASVGNEPEVEIVEVESKKRRLDIEVIEEVEVEKDESKLNWWEECKWQDRRRNWFGQKSNVLSEHLRPSDMPSGMILGLVIEDPRMRIPAKREKAVIGMKDSPQTADTRLDASYCESPIWVPEIRDAVSRSKPTTQQINEARCKKIVPGFDIGSAIPDDQQPRIPVLLVQRPGNWDTHSARLGFGSGWDIIAPAGFGMPIWLSLIFRGARTGGLKEIDLLRLECNNLNDYLPPDSAAGESENREKLSKLKTRYFNLPPNKRPNFTKLGMPSPFYPDWGRLIRDWTSKTEPGDVPNGKIRVLRDVEALKKLSNLVKGGEIDSNLPNSGMDCLIPISVEVSGKGRPNDLAVICLPREEDLKTAPVEPSHEDPNETERKRLKREHSKRLKSLKRKRRKERGKLKERFASEPPGALKWKDVIESNAAPSDTLAAEYRIKMEELWLPEKAGGNVADAASRRILGFVAKGGFSYSRCRGFGLGYVTLPGFVEAVKVCQRNGSKVVVLIRNRDQVQYRLAKLRVSTD